MRSLDYMIEVMTAARDGKKIECRCLTVPDEWEPLQSGRGAWNWNWPTFDYRIAPEPRVPRECYAVFSDGSEHVRMFAHRDRNEASAHYRVLGGDEVVHMREVLPGDVVPITPKRDAVIIQFIDGKRVISIECANSEALPHLEREAQMILHS
jgi:hypothetical protein